MNESIQRVLAIETSCDDTSVAVVESDGRVCYVLSASQNEAHRPFGGIVPEVASRNHTYNLMPLVDEVVKTCEKNFGFTWNDIHGVAVTNRPGLVGSLLVGVVTAKSLAQAFSLPLIGVNHLEGHLLAPFLRDDKYTPPSDFSYPYLGLAVSGGHTSLYLIKALGEYEVLGSTVDDAAGEAFDKFAKMVGLGYPGGVQVDLWAQKGAVDSFEFPRSMMWEGNFQFSFSGLKASAHRFVQTLTPEQITEQMANLCASYQEAIVDSLIFKLDQAWKANKTVRRAILTGGVSANSRLRLRAQEWADKRKVQLVVPPIRYCTDNAAMIGYVGVQRLRRGESSDLSLGVSPEVSIS